MNNSNYIILGLAIVLVFVVLLICCLIFRMLRKRNSDSTQERRAVLDDRGDELLWKYGNTRPIVDTLLPQMGLSRRQGLRKLALGALASFAGWMAARGKNLLWAEEILTKPGKTSQSGGGFYLETHTDNGVPFVDTPHNDVQHNDYTDHTDHDYHSDF